MKRITFLIIALALVAAACGEGDGSSGTTAPPTTVPPTTAAPTTTPPTTEPPTTMPPVDPNQRILEIRVEGGLAPPSFFMGRIPRYTLFADGRLVYEGATIAIFPGPLLPAVVQADIGADGLARVLAAIEEVGLPNITELVNTEGNSRVADAPDTIATYFDENGEHRFRVYALDIYEHTDEQVLELRSLVHLLDELTATSPDAGPFEIERLQVVSRVVESRTGETVGDPQPWPMTITPSEMTEIGFDTACAVVSVEDDPDALEAFRAADQETRFRYDDVVYQLIVRPLLTGETGCDSERV